MSPEANQAKALIERLGLLLLQDKVLPSLATSLAGEPVSGSWWSHPKGDVIYRAGEELGDDPDVRVVKLVGGKLTFVHRRHLAAVAVIGRAREAWQTKGLDRAAKVLLAEVDEKGSGVSASGKAVKALEAGLLVATTRVHTQSGAHRSVLCTWEVFAREAGIAIDGVSTTAAKREIEEAVQKLHVEAGAERQVKLPWS